MKLIINLKLKCLLREIKSQILVLQILICLLI
jgi:hypothetical protein